LSTQHLGDKTAGEVAAIQKKQDALDTLHDRKARGTFNVLTGFADLADDPDDAASYLSER
jgi:hypothetical protein